MQNPQHSAAQLNAGHRLVLGWEPLFNSTNHASQLYLNTHTIHTTPLISTLKDIIKSEHILPAKMNFTFTSEQGHLVGLG